MRESEPRRVIVGKTVESVNTQIQHILKEEEGLSLL